MAKLKPNVAHEYSICSTTLYYILRVASFHFSSSFITQYFKSPRLALAQGLLASQPPPSLIAIITGPGLQLTPYSLQLTPTYRTYRPGILVSTHSDQNPPQSWVAANIVCKMWHGPDRGDQMLQTSPWCSVSLSYHRSFQHLGDRNPI